MGWCIVYTQTRLLLLIYPFISSFSFLSNSQALKMFVTCFSRTVRPRRLKLGTHMNSGWMYCVYWNQAASAYSSLFFLSPQLSNIKNFRHTFLMTCEAYKVGTWYTREQWVDVSCTPESGCCLICPFISSFFFLSNSQNILSHFQGSSWLKILGRSDFSLLEK